jgi:hypothetical protein
MQAIKASPDFEGAVPYLTLKNVQLPGYQQNLTTNHSQPHQLVRRIIVQPSRGVLNPFNPKLHCWLDFYNPFDVNVRYYYISVDTFVGDILFGRLHVNFTDYDPFMFVKNYQYPVAGESGRSGVDKNDPYGPHPGQICLEQEDCQVQPVDVLPARDIMKRNESMGENHWKHIAQFKPTLEPGIHRTMRLQVSASLSLEAILKLIDSSWNGHAAFNVTLRGQVVVGMGVKNVNSSHTEPFSCPDREFPEGYKVPQEGRDSYCYPDNPESENVKIMWMDYIIMGNTKLSLYLTRNVYCLYDEKNTTSL